MSTSASAPGAVTPSSEDGDRFASGCAWIEGEYVPIGEARIPILDAGFVRSDLTYDVVGVWEGNFFRLDDHMERLAAGLRRIRLECPLPFEEVKRILFEVVRRSGLRGRLRRVGRHPRRPDAGRARPAEVDAPLLRLRDPVRLDRPARDPGDRHPGRGGP